MSIIHHLFVMMNEDNPPSPKGSLEGSPKGSPQSKKTPDDAVLKGNIEVQRSDQPKTKTNDGSGKVEVAPSFDEAVSSGWDRAPSLSSPSQVVIGVSDNIDSKTSNASSSSSSSSINKAVDIEISESLQVFSIDSDSSSSSESPEKKDQKKTTAAAVLEEVDRIVLERGKDRVSSLDLDPDSDTHGLCPLCCELLSPSEITHPSCAACEFNVCSVCLANLFMSNRGTCPGCRDDSFFVNVPSINKARTKDIIDSHCDNEVR
ncbi:hypothetical protein TL16_g02899 [Triparma laevis f. inornata]|uniref:RING-type domain-containing protein n=1 Tax=Triparma laevis f. inornata TaxID=1714386 RepID=A0A9W6ZSQ9_9STRA|nr:hypothetical protein TL16_g02899 [Triparma laevis f. inornata]